jgi:MFS transporter, DHA1 family, tetracycline resistance protein
VTFFKFVYASESLILFYGCFLLHIINPPTYYCTNYCSILRKALKKLSEEKLVVIGSLILGTNFILFVSNNIVAVGGAVVLFALGNGLMWPSFMSILSRRAGSKLQGAVQGVAGSFGGLASIVGLTLGGFSYNSIGVATFLISAGVIFAVFVMSFRLLKTEEA